MSDKLQLHEIAGYLPYGVKCQYEGIINGAELKKWDSEINLVNWSDHADYIKEFPRPEEVLATKTALIKDVKFYLTYFKVGIGTYHGHLKYFINGIGFKPILRPMSDFNGSPADEEIFNRFSYYISVTHDFFNMSETAYSVAEILFKHHFDVFNLIGRGLAIDVNTLKD